MRDKLKKYIEREADSIQALINLGDKPNGKPHHPVGSWRTNYERGANLLLDDLVECVETIDDGTVNSVLNTLALMAEGEGSDPKVYMQMAGSAHEKLTQLLEKLEKKYEVSDGYM